ncbi:hypothetical protein [Sphaerisporangium corydalis]|uniref:Uncharacterized protein n=1 Tax=Sphaerisporangium corydalis TaxID=1441875 RepID=A0ABV9ELV7_9ACTN|nr:hypothetical protein [Sphaerisporangium corydalis]
MRKIRNLLIGTALAGSLAAGLAAVPAQAATKSDNSSASQTQASRHRFGPYFSSFGRGEDRGDRSYVQGYWWRANGDYYFDFDLFDRDRDRQYAWLDVYYHDDRGWHRFNRYKTFGHSSSRIRFNDDDIDGFRFRVGEGSTRDYDWSGWHRYGSF